MALAERDPGPALRAFVRRYYGFRETTAAPLRRREGPGADVIFLLSFGFEWRIRDATSPSRPWARHGSFVAGLHEASVLTEHDGRSYGIQISLTPPGGYALFGVPMHLLAGRTVALDDLQGSRAEELVERLADLDDWAARFDLLDAALAARLADARPASPGVVWAWRQLSRTHGRVPIGELAGELGWSRKRLVSRFREEVGLSPKSLARLVRFERAKTLIEGADPPPFAQVALECGYYDQSHLGNEFRRISGTTPAAHVASRGRETNLQDGVASRS